MIIGLAGKKQSGKSTITRYLQQEYGFIEVSWAAPLKEVIGKQLFGLSHEQLYGSEEEKEAKDPRWGLSPREILQIVGTDLFRKNFRGDFWVHLGKLRIDNLLKNTTYSQIVVSDCRFPNECKAIEELGGVNVRIVREDKDDGDEHESETALDNYKFDHVVSASTGEINKLHSQMDDIVTTRIHDHE